MAQIKIGVTGGNEEALKEALSLEALEVDEKNKIVVEFESEVSEYNSETAIKFSDSISGVVTLEEAAPDDSYELLKIKTYKSKLSDGTEFESISLHVLSLTTLALRVFTRAIAPIKAKYAPKRNSMASVNKAKLKEEMARYKEAQKGEVAEAKSSDESTDEDF